MVTLDTLLLLLFRYILKAFEQKLLEFIGFCVIIDWIGARESHGEEENRFSG